jgi:hypothetical protein
VECGYGCVQFCNKAVIATNMSITKKVKVFLIKPERVFGLYNKAKSFIFAYCVI